jgi:hypothetical protein
MTNEEINIAIAEACGWRWVRLLKQEGLRDVVRGYPPNTGCAGVDESYVPDYCNDLNAMHQAEKYLVSNLQWNLYTSHLATLCGWDSKVHDVRTMANVICSATARQRAEAFLRTLNLWEE